MLFNVESDSGTAIVGYLVPDTFTGRSSILVRSGGIDRATLPTDEPRLALVEAGRHETGLCGFTLTMDVLPDLPDLADIELLDAETGIAIYRRCDPASVVHAKVFRLETHLNPLASLDRAFAGSFQFHFSGIDRHGLETTNQMLLMNGTDSVYASGRLAYRSVAYYLDKGYDTIAILHDPYDELAERLLLLRVISEGRAQHLSLRDNLALQAAVEFASRIPLAETRGLGRAFRNLEPAVAGVLVDPVVRQLTRRSTDEALTPSAVGAALGVLSGFAVVGLRRHADQFAEGLAAYLGLPNGAVPLPQLSPTVTMLSDQLRRCEPVEHLMELDLALYQEVAAALEKSLEER